MPPLHNLQKDNEILARHAEELIVGLMAAIIYASQPDDKAHDQAARDSSLIAIGLMAEVQERLSGEK